MAGRPGRSGGHNKLSPEEHLLRGTWNVTRHGPRPSPLSLAAIARVDPLPADVVDGLSGRGLHFVEDAWASYDGWTPASMVLLREAGVTITTLEGLRGHQDERAVQQLLLKVLAALNLD